MIFTGDAYIPGCKVVMNFPHSNKALAQSSVERILRMAEGKVVMPGHEVEARDMRFGEKGFITIAGGKLEVKGVGSQQRLQRGSKL